METPKNQYFNYFDALRCLAFLAVFYAHTGTFLIGDIVTHAFPMNYWKMFAVYGVYGVNFFFVLSGFLITYLLLKEKEKPQGISIRKFYIKRILRIWPVYFATLLISVLILPLVIPPEARVMFSTLNTDVSFPAFAYFAVFLGNFYTGLGLGFAPFSLNILWSVCIEEQFYLVWPWFIKYLNTRKLILATCLLISLSLLYKWIFGEDRIANYYITWSIGMDLAAGALLGIFYYKNRVRQIIVYSLSAIAGCILIIALVFLTQRSSLLEIVRLLKTPIVDGIFILILLFFIQKTPFLYEENDNSFIAFFHLSRQKIKKTLTYLGKISYGLYAFHPMCLMITIQFFSVLGLLTPEVGILMYLSLVLTGLMLTIAVSHISSKFMEKKFLDLKTKLD